jgi:NADP-dependent 3-hydroxy acid dehydrogenase YdfG
MAPSGPLAGRSALITGASAGIGRATAHALARDGANVTVAARREDRLRDLADAVGEEYGVETLAAPTDVTDYGDVESAVEGAVDAFGGLDLVVSNAGIGTPRSTPVDELALDTFDDVMAVNTNGMFYTARAAAPHLRESEGTLVFVGSFAGKHPRPHGPVYAATKWWTQGFALSLSGQLGEQGVAVSLVNPAGVTTEFGKEYREQTNEELLDPDEVLSPEDVAEGIAYAARVENPNTVSELNLYNRDKFSHF